nr:hypothetical protein [Rhodopila sp.]
MEFIDAGLQRADEDGHFVMRRDNLSALKSSLSNAAGVESAFFTTTRTLVFAGTISSDRVRCWPVREKEGSAALAPVADRMNGVAAERAIKNFRNVGVPVCAMTVPRYRMR